MDLERLKAKRTTTRSLFTRLTTKINTGIETPVGENLNKEVKLGDLCELRCQLIEKINELKELDLQVEKVVNISEIEKEVTDSEKYRETGIVLKSRLNRCISSLERTSNILQTNQNTEHAVGVTETNVIPYKTESNVKLPQITICTFNGDCSEWLNFYNSFEVAIHNNESLSKIEKFTYLKSYLRGTALTAISGFSLTNENYDSSIELLKQRFGRKDLAINTHMNKLLQLEAVKSVNNLIALRKLHDSIETQERKDAIKLSNRCYLCFKLSHTARICRKKYLACRCKNRFLHHKLLCDTSFPHSEPPKDGDSADRSSNQIKHSARVNSQGQIPTEVLSALNKKYGDSTFLQTFVAEINNKKVRGILDTGSSRSFVLKDIAEQLKLKPSAKEELLIYTFGSNGKKESFDIVDLNLRNIRNPKLSVNIKAAVTDRITQGKVSVPSKFIKEIALEKGLTLADDGCNSDIDLLIGSDFICEILGERNLKISKRLMVTNSIFGEILQGRINDEGKVNEIQVNYLSVMDGKMDYDKINEFWELENMGINSQENINLEMQILEKFEENTTYTNGRYETKLLWKDDQSQLNNNYEIAKKRLFNLNEKFKRDKNLYLNYKEIIQQQLKDGIVEYANCEPNNTCPGYFMPHHAVIREQKETTKVRICFDASSKSKGQVSLNDLLYSGPNLNPELLRIVLKFRIGKIAMCADIQRAFLEIGIKENDRKYLQFLWGQDNGTCLDLEGQPIRALKMKRVPFGVNCSPFILAATIRTHLKKYPHLEVTQKLNDLYVDDFLCSVETLPKAKEYYKDASQILKEAGMNLRKWVTSSPELEQWWKNNEVDYRGCVAESEVTQKVLGLVWNNHLDCLKVDIGNISNMKGTYLSKRSVLSICGMLFDPLGMLTPFTVRMKLLLQNTWERDLQWDEPLPPDIHETFQSWLDEVDTASQISLSRPYFLNSDTEPAEIHIFSDASPKAYGCVAYFRKVTDGTISSSFIVAKCRLAPLKKLSLARLELMGALVSARLAEYLQKTFPWITSDHIFFWSDSQITLHWINGDPLRWKEFVRNRVREIQEKTNRDHWNYCRGKTNPADKLTRGLSIHALVQDDVWWHGPDWLTSQNLSSNNSADSEINETDIADELTKNYVPVMTVTEHCRNDFIDNLLSITNDYTKLIRIISYVFRFAANCSFPESKKFGPVKADERVRAENSLIRMVQEGKFQEEIKDLKRGKSVSNKSKLSSLNVFIDENGILKVGGRLKHSKLNVYSKHPIVLPTNPFLTTNILVYYHKKYLHLGAQALLYQVRQKFWPINGKHNCKKVIFKCITCAKNKPVLTSQIMGDLPTDRVTPNHVFNVTAIQFDDFETLSPGHFLIGRPINGIVEPLLSEIKETRLSKWQKITKFSQSVWKVWKRDYLCNLQQRYKWKFKVNDVKVGTLVLMKNENLPGTKWLLGRISELFHGKDNQIRVVNIKLPNGTVLKRNVRDVAILPTEN
ncbi:hypothetical protein AVEN_214366-1 [Araneus ventricosus]|uniref:Reverse transcriptase domain-containing protein n=1 Tax=Araneus ventricosus TaxID=182803 RepID=A0A4Y2WXW7_ARAVE|nr:hypothetical protein AVEN_214366-1 [Araneus ventricosus]